MQHCSRFVKQDVRKVWRYLQTLDFLKRFVVTIQSLFRKIICCQLIFSVKFESSYLNVKNYKIHIVFLRKFIFLHKMKRTLSEEASFRAERLRQKKECKIISMNKIKQQQQVQRERLSCLNEQNLISRKNKKRYNF